MERCRDTLTSEGRAGRLAIVHDARTRLVVRIPHGRQDIPAVLRWADLSA